MTTSFSRKQIHAKLLDACRQCQRTSFLKRAVTDSTTSFEAAFANLATASLQDRSPALLDHLLGFELIEKSDENDRAIGIFGFKLGEQIVYAPVFFLNGELKGEELLYLPGSDTFVPNDENWVNYLLNRKPISIGKSVRPEDIRKNVTQPSFDMFRELPTKYSADLSDWAIEGVAGLLANTKKYEAPKLAVPELIEKSASAARTLLTVVDKFPTLVDPIIQCYGKNLIKRAIERVREAPGININTLTSTPKVAGDLQIYTEFVNNDNLTQDEKFEVRRKGYIIKDARETASVAYKTQEELTLQSPDKTGLYDVLLKPAIFERCFVSLAPAGIRATTDARKLVVKLNTPRKWKSTSSVDILVSEEDLCDEYKKWRDKLPTTRTLTSGNTYVLISEDGIKSTGIFTVMSVAGTDGGKTFNICWPLNQDYDNPRNRIMDTVDYTVDSQFVYRDSYRNRIDKLTISNTAVDFVELGDTLLLPKDAKVFKVKEAPKPTDCEEAMSSDSGSVDATELALASQSDIKLLIIKNSSELKVHTDNYEAYINNKRFSIKEALFHLVKFHGLREKAAKAILNSAKNGARFRIKYAMNPYHLQGPGVPTEWMDAPQPGADTFFGSDMQVQPGQEAVMPFADMKGMGPEQFGPQELTEEEDIRRQLTKAQQTGQKEVFDTQLLGTLLNSSRDDRIIDAHLPALVRGLDATERLLFNMYWHNDTFVDRFGDREVEEIEDALRNTVSQLGDLTMALKKREVGPRFDAGMDVDLAALGVA